MITLDDHGVVATGDDLSVPAGGSHVGSLRRWQAVAKWHGTAKCMGTRDQLLLVSFGNWCRVWLLRGATVVGCECQQRIGPR